MAVHLPVVRARGSRRADGSRARIIPADVTGRFTRLRRAAFALQLAIGLAIAFKARAMDARRANRLA